MVKKARDINAKKPVFFELTELFKTIKKSPEII